jgi:hypothetical protein
VIREDAPGPDCPDCEPLPERLVGPGTFHLWLASRHSAKKLRVYLGRDRRLDHEDKEDGSVFMRVGEGQWGGLLAGLSDLFSSPELDRARAFCKLGFDEPTLADFPRVRSLGQLAAFARSGWLLPTLPGQWLVSVFQPIVWADDPTKVAQECLLRAAAADGRIVCRRRSCTPPGKRGRSPEQT